MGSVALYCSLSVHVQSRLFPRNESKLKQNKVEKSQKILKLCGPKEVMTMLVASMSKTSKMVHKLPVEEKRKDNEQTILCRSEFKLSLVAVCKRKLFRMKFCTVLARILNEV